MMRGGCEEKAAGVESGQERALSVPRKMRSEATGLLALPWECMLTLSASCSTCVV